MAGAGDGRAGERALLPPAGRTAGVRETRQDRYTANQVSDAMCFETGGVEGNAPDAMPHLRVLLSTWEVHCLQVGLKERYMQTGAFGKDDVGEDESR